LWCEGGGGWGGGGWGGTKNKKEVNKKKTIHTTIPKQKKKRVCRRKMKRGKQLTIPHVTEIPSHADRRSETRKNRKPVTGT